MLLLNRKVFHNTFLSYGLIYKSFFLIKINEPHLRKDFKK